MCDTEELTTNGGHGWQRKAGWKIPRTSLDGRTVIGWALHDGITRWRQLTSEWCTDAKPPALCADCRRSDEERSNVGVKLQRDRDEGAKGTRLGFASLVTGPFVSFNDLLDGPSSSWSGRLGLAFPGLRRK